MLFENSKLFFFEINMIGELIDVGILMNVEMNPLNFDGLRLTFHIRGSWSVNYNHFSLSNNYRIIYDVYRLFIVYLKLSLFVSSRQCKRENTRLFGFETHGNKIS